MTIWHKKDATQNPRLHSQENPQAANLMGVQKFWHAAIALVKHASFIWDYHGQVLGAHTVFCHID